jgi:hypothetical protein
MWKPVLFIIIIFFTGCESSVPITKSTSTELPGNYYSNNTVITGYDGIPFGITLPEINTYLKKIEGIREVYNGTPYLYRVPTKTYYAYNVIRNNIMSNSDVTVYFKNNKIVMFKDVFSGEPFSDDEKALASFTKIASELTTKWGEPDYESPERITWIYNNVTANLTIELPDNSQGLPIIKITVWKN